MCVPWLVHVCDVTHFICESWLVHACATAHLCVCYDLFLRETWLVAVFFQGEIMYGVAKITKLLKIIGLFCKSPAQEMIFCKRDIILRSLLIEAIPYKFSCVCVPWLVHVCGMTRSSVVTRLIHVCDMTRPCVWQDSLLKFCVRIT